MARALTDRDVKKGFWYHRPEEGFPPTSIRDPEDYDGLPMLNVVCTQTNLPPPEQANLVRRWCDFLPTISGLDFLWFHSKVPQELFDAVCLVPRLQGLWIKWSSIESISSIVKSANLRFLRLGSSPQLASIEHLRLESGVKTAGFLRKWSKTQGSAECVVQQSMNFQGITFSPPAV